MLYTARFMLAIFEVTAPFFALILCGYLAARFRLLPENAVPALNTFVLWFALPCLLFRFSAHTPFGDLVNLPVFFAYLATGLALFAAFAAVSRFAIGESLRDAAFAALAASWSNWGYMGFALLPAILGKAAAAPLIAAGMADLLVHRLGRARTLGAAGPPRRGRRRGARRRARAGGEEPDDLVGDRRRRVLRIAAHPVAARRPSHPAARAGACRAHSSLAAVGAQLPAAVRAILALHCRRSAARSHTCRATQLSLAFAHGAQPTASAPLSRARRINPSQ